MFRKLLSCAVLIACSATANAGVVLDEGFDDFGNLPDWLAGNFSVPVGDSGWFQGNTSVFSAAGGAADSYIAANYANAAFGGNVDNWLVTPEILANGETTVRFSTRTTGEFPGDNLQVLVNNTGSLNTADFVSLGMISSAGYPTDWQAFSFTYGGPSANVRFAFRYLVTDTSQNGAYIGIDSVTVGVPEPGTMMLLGAGLLLMPQAMRRRRREQI